MEFDPKIAKQNWFSPASNKDAMKILIAVHHFPPRFTGGAELRALRTAKALQERGHTIRIVCIEEIALSPAVQGVKIQADTYEGLNVLRLSFNLESAPDPFRWSYSNPWIGEFFKEQFRLWQPDIFHLIGGYLMSASSLRSARENNIPRIVSLTDYWWLCPRIQLLRSDGSLSTLPIDPARCARCLAEEQRRYRLPAQILPKTMDAFWRRKKQKIQQIQTRKDLLRQELNQTNAIICPSRFLLETHQAEGITPKIMVYSRQGRDFHQLDPESIRKSRSDTLRVGYIGQITEIKGVHILFEAAQKLPEANLNIKIYGDLNAFPSYTKQLERIASQDPRLQLVGVFSINQLSSVLQNLDVIVVPSLWYENSPNVILEAFAHKTPVLASNLGGMAELVVHGKNGLLFQPGDPEDLSKLLKNLLEFPDTLHALSENIIPVKSTEAEIDELESIYKKGISEQE